MVPSHISNFEIQQALNYCEERVNAGEVWVCHRFRDALMKRFGMRYFEADLHPVVLEFDKKVQKFLHGEYQKRHGNPAPIPELNAVDVVTGFDNIPDLDDPAIKILRLEMIQWLRGEYPCPNSQ